MAGKATVSKAQHGPVDILWESAIGGAVMNIRKLYIVSLMLLISTVCTGKSQGRGWVYDVSQRVIYRHYSLSQPGWPKVKALLVVGNDAVRLIGLVPKFLYEKTYKEKTKSFLKLGKIPYAQHPEFLADVEEVTLTTSIDKKEGPKLEIINDFTAMVSPESYADMIEIMTDGAYFTVTTPFTNARGKKVKLFYDLTGFSKAYEELLAKHPLAGKKFVLADVKCRNSGGKKIVWMDTKHGSYVLNDHGESWLENSVASGAAILGVDGKNIKYGKKHIDDPKRLKELLSRGLKKCK